VLGLTAETLWRKLAAQVGEGTVDRIRQGIDQLTGAWAFLKDVTERGLSAIWEYVSDKVGDLWETIVSAAKDWVLSEIIDKVVGKLVSMLDPTGVMAVVNSFIAFFSAIQSAIEYLREILEIVNDFVSTVAAVAAGNIEPGAAKLEQGLASAVPVAIGFLANQVGLSNVPEKVVEIIQSLRQLIDEALDWLFAQAMRLGQAALAALGVGGEHGDATEEAQPIHETFSVGDEEHVLYTGQGSDDLWVASETPHKVVEIPQLAALVQRFRAAKDAQRTDEAREIKRQLKDHWLAWFVITESPKTGHAPNVGTVLPHKGQATRWRPQNVKGGQLPSWLPAWELESEHMIPRSYVDAMLEGLSLTESSESDYKGWTTVMLYRGASRRKTYAVDGDNIVINQLKSATAAAREQAVEVPASQQAETVMKAVIPLFGAFIHQAAMRTNDSVAEEDASHDINASLTNGEIRGEPPMPTEKETQQAFLKQAAEVSKLLEEKLKAAI
jgi:hypothetical protein